jgi:hypothetical protein
VIEEAIREVVRDVVREALTQSDLAVGPRRPGERSRGVHTAGDVRPASG